jgi:hypothetical protein
MNSTTIKILFWAPRVLCIAFAAFISIFALDVFQGNHGWAEIVIALLMHLIPTALILVILAVSWRWEWVGGALFLLLAGLYCWTMRGRFPLMVYVLMSGPLLLLSALFFLNWKYKLRVRN